MRSGRAVVALVAAAALLGACTGDTPGAPGAPDAPGGSVLPVLDASDLRAPVGEVGAGTTPASGNRWHPGTADLGETPVHLPAEHRVDWVLTVPLASAPTGDDTWAVLVLGGASGDGAPWSAWVVSEGQDGTARAQDLDAAGRASLGAPGSAPALVVADGAWIFAPRDELAPHAPVRRLGQRLSSTFAVAADGQLLVDGEGTGVPALPDGVAVTGPPGVVAILADPTDVYDHAVLGDPLEAGAVAIVVDGVVGTALPPGQGGVFETRAPLWADLTGDGLDDLVLTRSDDRGGAGVVIEVPHRALTGDLAFDPADRIVGDPIGLGGRWRHVIAVAPIDGAPHVVEVVTPHLARTLLVSRLVDGRLVPTLEVDTDLVTHSIGSRMLDGAAVFDADGDGVPDLVAPVRGGGLAARALGEGGARAAGEALATAVGAVVSSNLAVLTVPDPTTNVDSGRLLVAVGTGDGIAVFPG